MRLYNWGRPLSSIQKKMLFYGWMFVLGMGYLMLFAGNMHWPKSLLFSAIGIGGGLVASVAWWRYLQSRRVDYIKTLKGERNRDKTQK